MESSVLAVYNQLCSLRKLIPSGTQLYVREVLDGGTVVYQAAAIHFLRLS